jgi:hypothetical protein
MLNNLVMISKKNICQNAVNDTAVMDKNTGICALKHITSVLQNMLFY